MKSISIAALWLPTFLMACSPTVPKIETATSTNGADLLGAFHAAFGQAAPYRLTVQASEGSTEHELEFSPLAFISIGPDMVALVSKGEGRNTDYECHACVGAMTMHYLKRSPQGYSVLGNWPIVSGGAEYGLTNPFSIRTDLDDVPTMLVTDANGGQGCEGELDTLVALTPTGPEERGSFLRVSSYKEIDGVNGPKDYAYQGKVIATDKGSSFTVEYSGKSLRNIKFVKGSDRIYRARDTEFPPSC